MVGFLRKTFLVQNGFSDDIKDTIIVKKRFVTGFLWKGKKN